MPEAIHTIDKQNKIIKVSPEYADFAIVFPNLEITNAVIKHITYTTLVGKDKVSKVKEYRCLVTVQTAASFPLTLLYKDLQDVYGNDLPVEIEDAFVCGVQPVGFRREIYIVSYDDYGLVINLGSRGEPRDDDIQVTFVVKEG